MTHQPETPLMTAQELAAELRLTPKKIRKLAQAGKIPAERYGKSWRFDLARVRAASAYVDPITASVKRALSKVGRGGGRRGIGLRILDGVEKGGRP